MKRVLGVLLPTLHYPKSFTQLGQCPKTTQYTCVVIMVQTETDPKYCL